MDKPPSVFAGLKLSEQAPEAPTPVDQKLFGSPSPASLARPIPPNSSPPPAPEVAPAPAPIATRPQHQAAEPRRAFDLTDIPYRKETYLFTSDEFEALEDLKLTLRRQHDLKASKNDLARCAIQYLLEDFRRNGDRSPVIAPLRRRGSRLSARFLASQVPGQPATWPRCQSARWQRRKVPSQPDGQPASPETG